jgi:uncharacterized phage protein (TIGR02218 family)
MSATWLSTSLVAAAWCWRLERRDGVVVALTSHDRDLWREGQLYRAAPGMRPSRIEQNDRVENQSIDLSGAISSAAISAEDIVAGRWDGAMLTLSLADWEAPDAPLTAVASGQLGSVIRRGQEFSVELNGPITGLDQPVGVATSPTCRAGFGDYDCRVALAPLTRRVEVTAVDGLTAFVAGPGPDIDVAGGRLRWLVGAAAGLGSAILQQSGNALLLSEIPAALPTLPARAEVRAGCDKRLETCATRFANAINFRGEAHVPGFDLLTRYPGG